MRRTRLPKWTLQRWITATFEVEDWRAFRLCGMDEVGRGAYAGPLVAAAVVLPPRFRHPWLRDSKRLSAHQREVVADQIRADAVWAIAEIPVTDINTRGLGWANREVFRRLVLALTDADGYCCDGNLRIEAARPVHTLVKGDDLVPAISAASIIAKVHRDAHMRKLHLDAPHYNWASNKGYGALEHRNAILDHGIHAEHRHVFIDSLLQLDLALGPPGEEPAAAALLAGGAAAAATPVG